MVAAEPITVYVNGSKRDVLPGAQMAELVRDATRAAIATEPAFESAREAKLAAYVSWGAVLIQIRPHVVEGTFCQWLSDGGCKHRQKAYSAMQLATEYADDHGKFDRARFAQAVAKYNSECAGRDGFKPLSIDSMSVNTAEIAAGVRQGPRKPVSGTPDTGNPSPAAARGAAMVELPDIFGLGLPQQTAKPAGTVPVAPPAARAAVRDLDASGAVAASSLRTVTSGESGRAAAPAQPREVQLSLEDVYRQAADEARTFARMLDAHAVEPELMERFRSLVEEARAKRPGGW